METTMTTQQQKIAIARFYAEMALKVYLFARVNPQAEHPYLEMLAAREVLAAAERNLKLALRGEQ